MFCEFNIMYSLFKLVRLISIKEEVNSPKISTFAWRQSGERSLLALACTNGKQSGWGNVNKLFVIVTVTVLWRTFYLRGMRS